MLTKLTRTSLKSFWYSVGDKPLEKLSAENVGAYLFIDHPGYSMHWEHKDAEATVPSL